MASSSLSNLFSFFTPTKPPPSCPPPIPPPAKAPPSHVSLSSDSSSSKNRDAFAPLVASHNDEQQYPLSSDLMSVVCPSLAYANTLFFRSAYNVQISVDDNEPEEKLLGRFRREVMKAGIIQECKRRRFHENKQDEKKRKSRESAKRNRRRRPQAAQGRNPMQTKPDLPRTSKEDEDEEDNWDLPEGDELPF